MCSGSFPATTTQDRARFNVINRETGNRVRYDVVDADTGEEVPQEVRVKGYKVDGEDKPPREVVRRSRP